MKIRLTIAQRLWIGLGLLLSPLAAAYLFALHLLSTLEAQSDAHAAALASAMQTLELLSNGLLAALMLGAAIAAVTSFAVRAPLRRLIASVRGYVDGDLSYRSLSMRGDEVGELRWIFEAMVGRFGSAPRLGQEAAAAPHERVRDDGALAHDDVRE
jgi:methyl-accepting chemotaxis protein